MQRDLFAVDRPRADDGPATDDALDQFLTPSWAADLLVADVIRDQRGLSILEPSAGDGRLLKAIDASHHAFGVETDPRMAEAARERTGREVLCGDIRDIDLQGRNFDTVIANPPFMADVIDSIVERGLAGLPDGGVMGLVLPAHIPASAMRIERWGQEFAIETRLLPRSLFPRLTLPLVWTRMVKCRERTLVGFLLFDEASDVHDMPQAARQALQAGRTWRHVVADALATLGGEAELRQIYAAVEPRRRSPNPHWRDKTRQVLREYPDFARVDDTRWRLAA